MADTYEQNLSQKGTLTVSDYIRVVGSDNASYKQLVSDVAKKIIENYTGSSLAGSSQSVKSALDALNSKTTQTVTFTYGSKSVDLVFITSNNVLSVVLNKTDSSMALPTSWTAAGRLSGVTLSGDRYLPLISTNGKMLTIRVYADGGLSLIAHSSDAMWLQCTAATIM